MNFSELVSKVGAWMNRTDLSGLVPDFSVIVEDRINRSVRSRFMESPLSATTIIGFSIAAPSDTVDIKFLSASGVTLKPAPHNQIVERQSSDLASSYCWSGSNIIFDGTGSVSGVLYKKVPALATNLNNWVSDNYQNVYLFGCLAEATLYTGGDASIWQARFEQAISEMMQEKQVSGPLISRPC